MKRRSLDALLYSPLHGAVENACIVIIHTKDKAAIHHDAVIVQTADHGAIIAHATVCLRAGCDIVLGLVLILGRRLERPLVSSSKSPLQVLELALLGQVLGADGLKADKE